MSIRLCHIPTDSRNPTDPEHSQFQVLAGIVTCNLIVHWIVIARDARYLCDEGVNQSRDLGGYL